MPEAGAGAHRGERQANECELFKPRVTVARDAAPTGNGNSPAAAVSAPRNPSDARAAFDNLFKLKKAE